jgi:hypothetical protein
MTERLSVRAAAREIYAELAGNSSSLSFDRQGPGLSPSAEGEAARTPNPSPLLARASGGGEKDSPPSGSGAAELTAKARALYEGSAVPVAEIARLCGVTDRTIYKYAAKQNWKPRYRWNADGGRPVAFAPDVAPAKGAGGRFIRRDDKGKAFAQGLKATDPAGRAAALADCASAARLARKAQAKAEADAREEELIRALDFSHRALVDARHCLKPPVKGQKISPLQNRIDGLLVETYAWSVCRLEALVARKEAAQAGRATLAGIARGFPGRA